MAGKQRLNFANFITKERLNFSVPTHYHVDIVMYANLLTGKLNADWWQSVPQAHILERMADQCPNLFAHWRAGMTGTFA